MRPSDRRRKKVRKRTPGGRVSHRAPPKKPGSQKCAFCGAEIGGKRVNRSHPNLCVKCARQVAKKKVMAHAK